MKKFLFMLVAFLALAMVFGFSAYAAGPTAPERAAQYTLADFQAKFDQAMADGFSHRTNDLWVMFYRDDLADKRAEFDAALAAKRLSLGAWMYRKWPQTSLVPIENWKTNAPCFYAVFATEPITDSEFNWLSTRKATLEQQVSLLGEMLSKKSPIHSTYYLAAIRKSMGQKSGKVIKHWIRSHGQSFVEKDGKNPVQEHIDALVKCLDAPKFAGLDAWMAAHGLNARIDLQYLPDDEMIRKLKVDVLYGDVDFTDENKLYLMVALGTDEYNKFVKEYNGEN